MTVWATKKDLKMFTRHFPPPLFSFHHLVFSMCSFPLSCIFRIALLIGVRYGDPLNKISRKNYIFVRQITFTIVMSCKLYCVIWNKTISWNPTSLIIWFYSYSLFSDVSFDRDHQYRRRQLPGGRAIPYPFESNSPPIWVVSHSRSMTYSMVVDSIRNA